jgi:hypothetical protein
MRADPKAQHLLPKQETLAPVVQMTPRKGWPSRGLAVVHTRSTVPRVVSTRWNKKYALSTHKLGRTAHIIRTVPTRSGYAGQLSYSTLTWYPGPGIYVAHIKAWCSASWNSRRYAGRQRDYVKGIDNLGVILTNDPQGRPVCRACINVQNAYHGEES